MEGHATFEPATPAGCRLVRVPRFSDARGSLCVAQGADVPFAVQRLYCLYDVPGDAQRGHHAHLTEEELIFALAGSVRVSVDDGRVRREYLLDRPDLALYVPPFLWHELSAFAPGTVVAVLASQPYDPGDYLNAYEDFLAHVRARA